MAKTQTQPMIKLWLSHDVGQFSYTPTAFYVLHRRKRATQRTAHARAYMIMFAPVPLCPRACALCACRTCLCLCACFLTCVRVPMKLHGTCALFASAALRLFASVLLCLCLPVRVPLCLFACLTLRPYASALLLPHPFLRAFLLILLFCACAACRLCVPVCACASCLEGKDGVGIAAASASFAGDGARDAGPATQLVPTCSLQPFAFQLLGVRPQVKQAFDLSKYGAHESAGVVEACNSQPVSLSN